MSWDRVRSRGGGELCNGRGKIGAGVGVRLSIQTTEGRRNKEDDDSGKIGRSTNEVIADMTGAQTGGLIGLGFLSGICRVGRVGRMGRNETEGIVVAIAAAASNGGKGKGRSRRNLPS